MGTENFPEKNYPQEIPTGIILPQKKTSPRKIFPKETAPYCSNAPSG